LINVLQLSALYEQKTYIDFIYIISPQCCGDFIGNCSLVNMTERSRSDLTD